MDQAEANGKTVDDALSRALNQIGATRADLEAERVEMQVLDEGRKGIFGRGARDAVVRVKRIAAAAPAATESAAVPPKERQPRSRGGESRREGGQRQGGGQQQSRSSEDREQRSERGRRGRDSGGPRGGSGQRPARAGFEQAPSKLTEADFLRPRDTFAGEEPAAAPAPAPSSAGGRSRGRRGGSSRGGEARSAAPPAPSESPEPPEPRAARGDHDRDRSRRRDREEEPEVEPDINAEEVDFAAQTVDDILRLLDINGEISIREPLTAGDGRGVARAVIDIAGDDLGLLIGRRGDTLLSLQYLVNLVLTRQFPGRGGVSIDVEHYRHRREAQVMALTERMADRVRQTGSSITLEPMSAAERRLVHLALADDPDLVTNSIGEGENRKVVISSRR